MTTKLVRDRVPHTTHPGRPALRPATDFSLVPHVAYADAIAAKLDEEVSEFATAFAHCVDPETGGPRGAGERTPEARRALAQFITEGADVIEIVYAHARHLGVSRSEIDAAVESRRNLDGGFDAGVVLTESEEHHG
jgi:predicted house-cleaning noncanonical NTP pyrophosphatase (MazG superfamily)